LKISHLLRTLPVCLVLLALVQKTRAQNYNLLGPAWPAGSNVVMNLGLGPTTVALQDGSASWNASAADALDIWNGYVDFITLSSIASATVPKISGDGVNATFFSSTIFGDTFGDDTLAVTVFLGDESDTAIMTEADVVCNTAFRYDSYRGPLQSTAADIHRIFVHEFGHVLGLAHVFLSPPGQLIMQPEISDLDHPVGDDITGIRYLYGAEFPFLPKALPIRIGLPFIEDVGANNNPTSYSATDLPPGLILESDSGRISGTPTTSGVFNAVITAHGPIVDTYGAYQFAVLGLEEVPGLLSILNLPASSLVADPIRPRIYVAAGYAGISMIDTETFEVTSLVSSSPFNARLSISADASTLLYTDLYGSPVQEYKIDLETLNALPAVPIPGNLSAVLEGLNNQAYVAGASGVYQIDAATGVLQQYFAPPQSTSTASPTIAISPDRQTLYVARESIDGDLSTYDISTTDPMLLHQLSGSFASLAPSRDGQFLYYVHDNTGSYSLIQAQLPTLSPAKSLFASSLYLGPTEVGLDGSIYQSIFPAGSYSNDPSGSFSVYDPATLQQTFDVEIGNLQANLYPYVPLEIAFDNSGKYFFARVQGFYGAEVWVFSTDLASFPPPVHPTKNLLNISTRARVKTGEAAMIGGFIVQGPNPKKVLIRGIGPSLPLTGAMSNPVLDLYDSSGKLLASDDDWTADQLNIIGSQLAPSSKRESAILVTLQPGAYTAVVRDLNTQPGLALVEVYDLDPRDSLLANISTRGKVETADNVMIAGFIIGGAEPTKVIVRAIGPSLTTKGIQQPLADPILELHDGNGDLASTNDNWRSTQQAEIIATGIPPTDDRESAILATLQPGSYTAIVRGQNSTTGVALVEVYNLDGASAASK
jgi:Putative Ig domain/Matrixin